MSNTKRCTCCNQRKPIDSFRKRSDNSGKRRSDCRDCENEKQKARYKKLPALLPETQRDPTNPKEAKEIAMKRMLSSAKSRAKEKGLMFDIHYEDVSIPNLCPVLKIPLIPSTDGSLNDNSPSLDRMVPYLGYTKGNVKVISMKANRIKTDATSNELEAVLEYVKQIEQENT